MRSLALLTAVLMCAPARMVPGQAGDAATREVRAVVDSFFAAFDAERWHDAARFIDAGTFDRWFGEMVASGRAYLPPPEETVDDVLERNPGMPREAAAWELAQRTRRNANRSGYEMQFARVTSFRELQALSPVEAKARWLEAQGFRHRWRTSILAMWECSPATLDSLSRSIPAVRHRVIGALVPRSAVAYALFESSQLDRLGDERRPPPPVLMLKRTPEGWRVPVGFATRLENGGVTVSIPMGPGSNGPTCIRRQ